LTEQQKDAVELKQKEARAAQTQGGGGENEANLKEAQRGKVARALKRQKRTTA
jgi:hypothetical protein